ncbi:MAG: hypothetical protein ACFBWO_06710 [Paracoccaceae bacterium]
MTLSTTRRRATGLLPRAVASLCLLAGPVVAQEAPSSPVRVELNKLEPIEAGCRSYLVIDSAAEAAIEALTLDVVVFDAEAVVARRLAVDVAPLAAGRTAVKVFDLDGLACGDVGRFLLNGVLACDETLGDGGGDGGGCREAVATASRARVPFDG